MKSDFNQIGDKVGISLAFLLLTMFICWRRVEKYFKFKKLKKPRAPHQSRARCGINSASDENTIMETMKFEEASPADSSAEASAKAEGGASQGENNSDAPQSGGQSSDQKRRRKLIWAGIILAALILAVIGWQYWQYTQSPYYQQMRGIKYLEKMAEESDKWGGKTPEETVRLFTEAIKKGDFELASKYGNPEEIKPDLEKIKNEGNIHLLIKDLEIGNIENKSGFSSDYVDLVIKENGKVKYFVLTISKSDGGTWKIVEF